jgi:hypothetical protein
LFNRAVEAAVVVVVVVVVVVNGGEAAAIGGSSAMTVLVCVISVSITTGRVSMAIMDVVYKKEKEVKERGEKRKRDVCSI